MNPDDTHAVDVINENRNVWYCLWTYPSKRSAEKELKAWGGKVAGRELRVREI